MGDNPYGTVAIREYITSMEAGYTISPKANTLNPWECDYHVYKERYLVECLFNKLKHFKRVATRYDKLASSFLAFTHIAAVCLLVIYPILQTIKNYEIGR